MQQRRRVIGRIVLLVVSGAIAVAAFLVWNDPLRRLEKASPRRLEARLAAFPYAPLHVTRSAAEPSLDVLTPASELQSEYRKHPTPQNAHRYAVGLLQVDRRDEAIQVLTDAAKQAPADATILSDLSAAQLAGGNAADAAENAGKALDVDPTSPEAAFNWALAIEALAIRPAAIKAWSHYLELDRGDGWAAEARAHMEPLRAPRHDWAHDKSALQPGASNETITALVSRYPQRVRSIVQDEILPRWIDNRQPQDLALLQAIGEARARLGDPFLRDVAAEAISPSDGFVEGVRAYRVGRKLAGAHDFTSAVAKLNEAEKWLSDVRSPLAIAATISAASNEPYLGQGDVASARAAAAETLAGSYPSLAAETWWTRGLVHGARSEFAEALHDFRQGRDLAQRAGESEHVLTLTSYIANDLEELGDTEEADRSRIDALRRMDEAGLSPQRMYVAYSEAGLSALQRQHPHVALAYIDSQEGLAHEANDPLLLAESATARAVALRDLGRADTALQSLHTGQAHASKIETAALRDRATAESEYIEASIQKLRAPHDALASLTSAVHRWQANGWRHHAASAHLALGNIRLSLGDRRGAEEEYRAGIDEMEQERREVKEDSLRIAYFEKAEDLFERLVELLIDEKRFEEAFAIAEQKRARALLDTFSAKLPPKPADVRTVRAALPSATAILEYEVLPTKVIVWCITGNGLRTAMTPTPPNAISKAADRLREKSYLRHPSEADRAWLYQALLAPVLDTLDPATTLVVVPDGPLFRVPFAALMDNGGRYLAESHPLVLSPSASIFVSGAARPPQSGNVLAVAQPSPRDFPSLPGALSEAFQVGDTFPSASILVGTATSPRDFLRRAATASIVTFAGHADNDSLIFEAPPGQSASLLTASQIMNWKFPQAPLVVLAACDTGRGHLRHLEGADNLATAFLSAGASSVVATLWSVEDGQTAQLLRYFYQALHAGKAAPDALRLAQIEFITHNEGTARSTDWASFFIVQRN